MPRETFNVRLRRLRVAAGLSQRQLASDRVTYAYISRLEAGTRRASLRAVRTLARRLRVNPAYLETGQGKRCPHCGGVPDPEYVPRR